MENSSSSSAENPEPRRILPKRIGPSADSKPGLGTLRVDPDGRAWFFDRVDNRWVSVSDALFLLIDPSENA